MTIDSILQDMDRKIKENIPILPGEWLDHAAHLNVLLLELDDSLVRAEAHMAHSMANQIKEGATASAAKIAVQGAPEYESYLLLKARKERVVEFIRISKKRVELSRWSQ